MTIRHLVFVSFYVDLIPVPSPKEKGASIKLSFKSNEALIKNRKAFEGASLYWRGKEGEVWAMAVIKPNSG